MKPKRPSLYGRVTNGQTMTAGGNTTGHLDMALAARHCPTVSLPQRGQEPGERRRKVQEGVYEPAPLCRSAAAVARLGL